MNRLVTMLLLPWSTTDAAIGAITATGAAMIAVARNIMEAMAGADMKSRL